MRRTNSNREYRDSITGKKGQNDSERVMKMFRAVVQRKMMKKKSSIGLGSGMDNSLSTPVRKKKKQKTLGQESFQMARIDFLKQLSEEKDLKKRIFMKKGRSYANPDELDLQIKPIEQPTTPGLAITKFEA